MGEFDDLSVLIRNSSKYEGFSPGGLGFLKEVVGSGKVKPFWRDTWVEYRECRTDIGAKMRFNIRCIPDITFGFFCGASAVQASRLFNG